MPLGTTAPVNITSDGSFFMERSGGGAGSLYEKASGNDVLIGGTATSTDDPLFYNKGLKGIADLTNATAASWAIIKY